MRMTKGQRRNRLSHGGAFLTLVLVFCIVASVFAAAGQSRHSLEVTNLSLYTIYRLYMSQSHVNSWGPDQLADEIIAPGETFTLYGIVPGEYDIMIVDEDGDKCVLEEINVFESLEWNVRTADLLECEGYR